MKKFVFCALILAAVFSAVSCAAAKDSGVGINALDFKLLGLDQKPYSLNEYRGKENALLFFWTTWCPFCRKEIKKINEESAKLSADGIMVLAINVGEPQDKVEKYVQANGIKLTVLLDEDNAVSGTYGIMGVPTFFLVNKSGLVVFSDNYFPDDYKGLLPKN